MHSIPSILPSLYDWSFWVPFFFRLFLAYQLYREARRLMGGTTAVVTEGASTPTPSAKRTLAWMLMALSFFFFVGLGVQIIAVFAACAFALRALQLPKTSEKETAKHFLYLLALVSFSLIFLGPGPYAIDLPL